LVSFVRATGLYDYIHFDRDYAQSVGARDAFISTPHITGLFCRLLTDWSGPDADVKSINLSIKAQSCTNDVLQFTGRVGKKYVDDTGNYLVDIVEMVMGHELAPQSAVATATMILPSRIGGPVQTSRRSARNPEKLKLDPDLPDIAKDLVGRIRAGLFEPAWPLTVNEIHLWCECLEDWNPLYWNDDHARKSRYGGIIAPFAGSFFGAGSSVRGGIGYLKPGEEVPMPIRRGLLGLPLLNALRQEMMAEGVPFTLPGFPEIVIVGARADYFKPLRPGDSVHTRQEFLNCGAEKQRRLGTGHIISWVNSAFNQHDELLKNFTFSAFLYHV